MMIGVEETESEQIFPNKNLFFSSSEYNMMENQNKLIPNEFNYEYLEKKKEYEPKSNDQYLPKKTDSLNPSKLIKSILPNREIAKIEFSVHGSKFCQNTSDYDSTKNEKINLLSANKENKVNFSLNLSGMKKLPSTNFNFQNHNLKPIQLAFKNNQNQKICNDELRLNGVPQPHNKNGSIDKKENDSLKFSNESFLSKNEKIQNKNFTSKDEKVQEFKVINKKFEFSEKEKNYVFVLPKNQVCKYEKKKFEFTLPKNRHKEREKSNMEENKYSFLQNFQDILEKISENSENEEAFQISKNEFYNYPEVREKEKSSIKKKEKSLERIELFDMNLSENDKYELESPLKNKNSDPCEQRVNKEVLRKDMIDVQLATKINESKFVLDSLETKIFDRKSKNIY